MSRHKPDILYRLEYIAYRTIETLARIIPLEVAIAIARCIANVWWFFDRDHRQVAHENLCLAFGDKMSESRRQEIIRGVFLHIAVMVLEMIKLPQVIRRGNWREYVDFQHGERLFDVLNRGGGVVIATGHLGNFELSSYFFNMTEPPMLAVGRRLNNPYLDDYLWANRERLGERIVRKKGGIKYMATALRRGECIGFVADQDAGSKGLFVDFFGRKASTHASFAALAFRMKVPILPGYACRVGHPMKYRIYIDWPIKPVDTGDPDHDIRVMVQEFNHRLEKYITEFPEQWMWTHRRWKTRPPEELAQTAATPEATPVAAGEK